MNTGEFNTWLGRHQSLFPKLNEWFEAQGQQRPVILAAWAKAMEPCTAAHAADATDRMLRGVGPLVEFNDWATLPAVMLQHCRLMGSGKVERAGDGNYVRGAAVSTLRQMLAESAPEKERAAVEELEQLIEVMGPDDLRFTKRTILDAMDDRIGAGTAYALLGRADARFAALSRGNAGDAWEGGHR